MWLHCAISRSLECPQSQPRLLPGTTNQMSSSFEEQCSTSACPCGVQVKWTNWGITSLQPCLLCCRWATSQGCICTDTPHLHSHPSPPLSPLTSTLTAHPSLPALAPHFPLSLPTLIPFSLLTLTPSSLLTPPSPSPSPHSHSSPSPHPHSSPHPNPSPSSHSHSSPSPHPHSSPHPNPSPSPHPHPSLLTPPSSLTPHPTLTLTLTPHPHPTLTPPSPPAGCADAPHHCRVRGSALHASIGEEVWR